MYESDLTKFMRDLFQRNPRLAQAQKEARAIWWDKKVDLDALKRAREARVPIRGYAYYPLREPAGDGQSSPSQEAGATKAA
jgi:hypothetical protein